METHLDIQLSEEAFILLSQQAQAAGKTPAELAASLVEKAYTVNHTSSAKTSSARRGFEECFGSVDMGRPVGIENQSIDADLGRAYDSSSEPI